MVAVSPLSVGGVSVSLMVVSMICWDISASVAGLGGSAGRNYAVSLLEAFDGGFGEVAIVAGYYCFGVHALGYEKPLEL